MKKIIAIVAIVSMGIASFASADEELVPGYVTNSYGEVWKNSYGECWRDSFESTTEKKVECGYPAPIVACNQTITVNGVNFDFDKSVIKEGGLVAMNQAVTLLKNGTGACENVDNINIVGHTDSIGSDEYNDALSFERATTVTDYLKANSVNASMTTTGAGEREPVADNATAEGRAENRRVEIEIKTSN